MENFLKSCEDEEETLELNSLNFNFIQAIQFGLLDHYTFYHKSVYHLIIHGNDSLQKVYWKNKFYNFSQLPNLIREEQKIPNDEDIIVKVYTCYGGLMPYYVDTHTLIISAFDNIKELYYKLTKLNNKYYCKFSKVAV